MRPAFDDAMAATDPATAPAHAAAAPAARRASQGGRELVLAVIATHAGSLLALARRHSLCADDAHDAYQRSLEIFLRRADSLDPGGAPAWLRTVVKHEAMAVRAARLRIVGPAEVDLDRAEARELVPADERAAAGERHARSTEALARLKPQEVRALVLKARGYSYREIAEITGWTYTKVNRCLTEGRRAFLARFAEIEAGRECERWAETLSALADGEAGAAELAAARPHLRHCRACRATLREFRAAPRAVAALVPAPAMLAAEAAADAPAPVPGALARLHDALTAGWHERVLLSAHKVQAGVEAASAGKLAAVAASATALAGGGTAALTEVAGRPPSRPAAVAQAARVAHAAPPAARPPAAPARDSVAPAAVPRRSPGRAGDRRGRVRHGSRDRGSTATGSEFDLGGGGAEAWPRRGAARRPAASVRAGASSAPAAVPGAPAPAPSPPASAPSPGASSPQSEFGP